MKNTYYEILESFELISLESQQLIKGGTGIVLTDAQLQLMFNYNSSNATSGGLGGFDSAAGQAFSTIVRQIASTDIGASVITSLYSKIQSNTAQYKIEISDFNPGGIAQYVAGNTNQINAGVLIALDVNNQAQAGEYFNLLSHELYHAYQEIVLQNPVNDNGGPITGELDAYLFEGLTAIAYDSSNNMSSGIYQATPGAYYNNQIGQFIRDTTNPDFVSAWNNMMLGGYDASYYNELIKDFQTSDFNSNHTYSTMTTATFTNAQLSTNALIYLESNFYSYDFTPTAPQQSGPSDYMNGSTGGGIDFFSGWSDAGFTIGGGTSPNDGSQLPCPTW